MMTGADKTTAQDRQVLRKWLCGAWKAMRREEGASLVEIALIIAFLFPPMIFGTAEFGSLVYASIEVTNAAHAGAAYAAQYYNATATKGTLPSNSVVQTAAQNDAPLTGYLASGSQLTTQMSTGCTGFTGNTSPSSCSTGVLPYVQVTATATVVPLIQLNGLLGTNATSMTMNSTATLPLIAN